MFVSFFEKLTDIRDSSKSDNSFKSIKVLHNFFGNHKNKLIVSNEKIVNSKMIKVETNERFYRMKCVK